MNIESEIDAVIEPGKLLFPKHIILIILNQFFERFSFFGLRTILIIYFTQFIKTGDNTAVAYFHAFSMLCCFASLLGALLSDGYIGQYKTIVYVSLIYGFGDLILCLTSIKPLGAPNLAGTLIGLVIIAFGTGGISPCCIAFGGDQFKSGQEKFLDSYFSIFYLVINIGAFLGSIITPLLRSDVKCFDDDCYSVAFGFSTMLMFVSIIVFVTGKSHYHFKIVNSSQNLFKNLINCIAYSIKMKIKNRHISKLHWLDHAQDKYDEQFINDVKSFSKVLFMFIPLPIFWALYDQQGSRWTLQAQKMNFHIAGNYYIQADQVQSINPILIMILIPTFNWIIYPAFEKCNLLKKPLQRMTVGMLLACVAFMISALLEYNIQNEFMKKNSSPNSIQLVNLTPLDINVNTSSFNETIEPSMQFKYMNNESNMNQTFTLTYNKNLSKNFDFGSSNDKYLKNNYLIYFSKDTELKTIKLLSSIQKEPIGKSQLRIYYLNSNIDNASNYEAIIETKSGKYKSDLMIDNLISNIPILSNYTSEVDFDEYELSINNKIYNSSIRKMFRLDNGARYTFIFYNSLDGIRLIQLIDIYGNQINFLYQLVQYFIITSAEIMFSVSGLTFAYSQAPESMKSLLQAAWLLTVAFGNLIVVIIAEGNFLPNQVYEYGLFALLILIFAVVFAIMSFFYVYKETTRRDEIGAYSDDELTSLFSDENTHKQSTKDQLIGMNALE